MYPLQSVERLDTLLALALASVKRGAGAAADARPERTEAGAAEELDAAVELLSELPLHERRALRGRAESLSKLTRAQQAQWLTHKLATARSAEDEAVPDEYIHPSHVAEAMREEARNVWLVILRALPQPLAQQSAELLGVAWTSGLDDAAAPDEESAAEVPRVIRRAFLARFVLAAELSSPTALDKLSGVELRRLVKFLGAHEIADACRRIPVEDVPLFLRRFPPEDTRMIAPFISPHAHVEPRRAALAERLVEAAVSAEVPPEAMLNHVGLKLLAMAICESGAARLRYTAQKIPYGAAAGLDELVANCRETCEPEMVRAVAAEAEALAVNLRRPQPNG